MINLILFLAISAIIILDLKSKISVLGKWNAWYTLLFMPHIFLLFHIKNQYLNTVSLTLLVLYSLYCLIRIHICPILKDNSGKLRLKIMIGGRTILLFGFSTIIIQSLAYILLLPKIQSTELSNLVLSIDGIITIIFIALLILNGMFRILFTSKRLGIVKRIVFLITWWIPIFNVIIILYFCNIVKWEYDHECYKVINQNARVDSQVCKTKYPLVMVHGLGFRDLKYINYWGRIPKQLIKNGAKIYYGHQEAWGTIEDNAETIKFKIMDIINETHCDKVNIIAHSKGGLDARYMIHKYEMGSYIASLTTIGTPHQGSEILDLLSILPEKLYIKITKIINLYFKKLGDSNPDSYRSSKQMMPSFVRNFNKTVLDSQFVYYQSYATIMKNILSDTLLALPYFILKIKKGPNDGLVSEDSAKWGEFKGTLSNKNYRGISHGDIIDLKREDYKGFDVIEQYIKIVSELKNKGF